MITTHFHHSFTWGNKTKLQLTSKSKTVFKPAKVVIFHQVFKLLQHTLALEALAGLVDLLEFDDLR